MSAQDEWYRSAAYDESTQALFERKVASAREWTKPQYIRIKALALLQSDDASAWNWGLQLTARLIDVYAGTKHRSEAASGFQALGDHHVKRHNYSAAEDAYRRALEEFKNTNVGSDTSLRLAEVLVLGGKHQQAVDELGEPGSSAPAFNDVLWRTNVCFARALFHLGDTLQAARNAKRGPAADADQGTPTTASSQRRARSARRGRAS